MYIRSLFKEAYIQNTFYGIIFSSIGLYAPKYDEVIMAQKKSIKNFFSDVKNECKKDVSMRWPTLTKIYFKIDVRFCLRFIGFECMVHITILCIHHIFVCTKEEKMRIL